MFLSWEIYIKLSENYTKTYICKILFKIGNIKQIIFNKYASNLKITISQRSLRNSSLLLLLFEFNNFSFLIDIIDNILYASGTCHQNSNQWQCSIMVTCLRLYHMERVPVTWYGRISYIYTFWYNFDKVLCQLDVV